MRSCGLLNKQLLEEWNSLFVHERFSKFEPEHLKSQVAEPCPCRSANKRAANSKRLQVEARLGKVRMFFPENPTGRYTLMLSQLAHQCVAKQLLLQYTQQYDNKLTRYPNRVCFTACNMDGAPTNVSDPHKL